MPAIMVPKKRAETPIGGGDFTWPKGAWKGVIDTTNVRAFPDFIGRDIEAAQANGKKGRGYASGDGEILSLQVGSNVGLGEQEDVGARKFFIDFVIRDGDVSVEAGPAIPEASWQMQRSAALAANLAISQNAVEEVEFEGETMVATSESFLEDLKSGAYNGTTIGYDVATRPWTSKDKTKTGVNVEVTGFFTAV
mgnify:CR=1 FL=1